MPLDLNPKLVVAVALALPIIYIWSEWEFSILILAALAGFGWYYMNENTVNKSELEERGARQLGPQQPFLPPEKSWEIGPDGTPIPKYQPPYPTPPGRR